MLYRLFLYDHSFYVDIVLRLVSSQLLILLQFLLHFISFFFFFAGHLVLSRSLCCLLHVGVFVLCLWWGISMRYQIHGWNFYFLKLFFFPFITCLARTMITAEIKSLICQVRCFSLILIPKPFWSPDWNPPVSAVISDCPRIYRLSIKMIDSCIFSTRQTDQSLIWMLHHILKNRSHRFILQYYHNSHCKWLLCRCPWCNGYRRRKWTRRHEFKSSTRLIAFHIVLILLGKVWIQLFSLQLWVNSGTD